MFPDARSIVLYACATPRKARLRRAIKIMSLPPHDKDNPIPDSLKRTIDVVKLVHASLSAEVLTENARRDLVIKLSLEAGSTRKRRLWECRTGLLAGTAAFTPPLVAHFLVSKDVRDFVEANGSRYWTNEGYYRRRATSAALAPLDPANGEGPSIIAPATPSTAVVYVAPQIVTIKGVGEVPSRTFPKRER
ncbi:BQ5605_C007g04438 [Microbotryum silenes-dioicae]|uniref:BQ5605_C007g04438 protein n=1 Tax=Microbotryum silenes-dioicae TaxID=796604 RepID=A0A2X0P2P4_9BASI|nr:BQ5605_C007g04438 [Microbotryum silenes-dioicae]